MRDLILLSFTAICLIVALRYPFAGLLTWAWFTLMAPHQAAYGAFGVPLNAVIAGATLVAVIASGEIRRFKLDPVSFLFIALAGWMAIAQAYSLDPANSAIYYERFTKTLLFAFLCAQMATDKLRFHALVWMLVISIGFFAAKGAIFTLLTFGQFHVQGMPNTVLEDNNHFGIATATMLPMILYLHGQAAQPWVKRGLLILFALSVLAIIGTQSRGAFVSLLVFSGFFWVRAKRKLSILAGMMLVLIPAAAFMPSTWSDRMATISEATEDASFMGRVDAWAINAKLAQENPLTGAGLRNSYQKDIAAAVDRERAERAKAAHSIYFEMLGGAGYVGLGVYLMLFARAFFGAWKIYLSRGGPGVADWQARFAYHAQTALVVFAVGGASASMEMWDGYLVVIALIGALTRLATTPVHTRGYALRKQRAVRWRRALGPAA
ncbi:MAG: putative O-glycosylation ligase, exosortase A system-associated [Parvularculaceae bacterium]